MSGRDTRPITEDVMPTHIMSFKTFHLKEQLLMGIRKRGYRQPTPVQEEAIPAILAGRDVLARAKNGVGKTAAFAIPLLEKLDTSSKHIQALVVVPSRELAAQHSEEIGKLGHYITGFIPPMCVIGGVDIADDQFRLKQGVQIIVCTPGRMMDLIQRGSVDLSHVSMFVLDEADRLLEDTFVGVVSSIRGSLPRGYQTCLFSATFPVSVSEFQEKYMKNTIQINMQKELCLKGVKQYHLYLQEEDKPKMLQFLFCTLDIRQSVIFVSSKERAEDLVAAIQQRDFRCLAIHSDMTQDSRLRAFHEFREGRVRHLVATDLFTRGIDSPAVNVVINFDFPRLAKDYLHRIGRAGRYGHGGLAISFVTKGQEGYLWAIQRDLKQDIPMFPIEEGVSVDLYDASTVPMGLDEDTAPMGGNLKPATGASS